LKRVVRIPIVLPTYLGTEDEDHPIYAIVDVASQSRFKILLAFTKDCLGQNVCRYGMVSGQIARSSPKGKATTLSRGVTGYFVDATCDGHCSDSTITWDMKGYRYVIGIKAEKIDRLIKVANSAIDATR
jgi:hypothetical protein